MLQKIGFQPGINKQITATGAEGQWVDCDNVRFRYGIPEKMGGWNQLGTLNENELTGAGRGLHHFINSLGRTLTNIIISITNNKLVRDNDISTEVSILLYLRIIDKKQVE